MTPSASVLVAFPAFLSVTASFVFQSVCTSVHAQICVRDTPTRAVPNARLALLLDRLPLWCRCSLQYYQALRLSMYTSDSVQNRQGFAANPFDRTGCTNNRFVYFSSECVGASSSLRLMPRLCVQIVPRPRPLTDSQKSAPHVPHPVFMSSCQVLAGALDLAQEEAFQDPHLTEFGIRAASCVCQGTRKKQSPHYNTYD